MSAPTRLALAPGRIAETVASLRPPQPDDISALVSAAIAEVKERGDAAVVEAVCRFDSENFIQPYLKIAPEDIERAGRAIDPELYAAIGAAADQVLALSFASMPQDRDVVLPAGQEVTLRQVPIASAGCYVPGGRASYPSSLIMSVVPAQVAGVERIAVVTPPGPSGAPAEVTLATAAALGVDEVYAAGGAAAVAALAYGTETIPRVDIITGPGNSWVQEAKRQVAGDVGVDSGVAGPSEIVALVDDSADPEAIALDLLAQAEHGPDSPAIALSTQSRMLDRVAAKLDEHGPSAGAVALIDVPDWSAAIDFAEEFAPEHLQLNLRDAQRIAGRIRSAGAVFIGPNGGTAFGDYVAGSNHILPTGGAARFASALGTATYLRRMSVVNMTQPAVDELAPHLAAIADAEGFPAHRDSALVRRST